MEVLFMDSQSKLVQVLDLPPYHFRITVESTVHPTYAELCKAYDWVSDVWDESKYKLELHESLREIVPVTGDKVVFLKKFDRSTTDEEAVEWAKSNGYRLAFPSEREAFPKTNPDLEPLFWIVDLGSFNVCDGRRNVPVISGNRSGCDLGWGSTGRWDAVSLFLFVRE